MFQAILSWLLDGKMIKTTAASAIGSGAVVIGLIDAKMSEVKSIAEKDRQYVIEYVNQRHDRAIEKIDTLIETNREIKNRLEKIDDRLFNINKKMKD
jgi:esterase/lipase